ncbi:MAG: hypothetical protein Q7R57_06860, partial [Dehalococcoidales bacterium]|nr:hypothetical protein [Dehalococcoidales bacterium]
MIRLAAGWLLSLTLAAFFLAAPALALPQMPQQFYGSVTINGIPAPAGIIISARIGGIEYSATVTDARGKYGYVPVFFTVPADATETTAKEGGSPGDIVQLCVADVSAGMTTFSNGQVSNMDLAVALSAPSVASRAATSVATTTATLNGEFISRGTPPTANVSFDYGTTTDYGNTTPPRAMTYAGMFSASVNLTPGVLYHFRARADGGIHGSSVGADRTLTTLPLPGGTPPATPAPAPTPTPTPISTPTPAPMPPPS